MKGSLQTASAAVVCKNCQGDTPPSELTEKGIVVDAEKYDIVDRVGDQDADDDRTLLHGMSKQVNHILPDPHRQEPRGQHEAEH